MAMKPVYKPTGEVTAQVNGMFVGKTIHVFGRVHPDADRFGVDLKSGNQMEDYALHINVRFAEGQVVRNSFSGNWGSEERDSDIFPFKQGDVFEIKITCMKDHYVIGANGYDTFATYRHRLPFGSVTHVSVGQDCDVTLLTSGIEGLDVPALTISEPSLGIMEFPFYSSNKRKIQIVGTPTDGNGRIDINLITGDGQSSLYCNPRLDEKQIVRNTRSHSGWGGEERTLNFEFPFQSGVPFQMTITITKMQFVVDINGMTAFTYANRMHGTEIRTLEISKDVKMEKITFF